MTTALSEDRCGSLAFQSIRPLPGPAAPASVRQRAARLSASRNCRAAVSSFGSAATALRNLALASPSAGSGESRRCTRPRASASARFPAMTRTSGAGRGLMRAASSSAWRRRPGTAPGPGRAGGRTGPPARPPPSGVDPFRLRQQPGRGRSSERQRPLRLAEGSRPCSELVARAVDEGQAPVGVRVAEVGHLRPRALS